MASMLEYNPLFSDFQVAEPKKPTIQLPLMDNPLAIDEWADYITPSGNIVAKDQTSETTQQKVYNVPSLEEYSGTSEPSSSSGKQKQAMDFFQSKGLPRHQAAGIVSNLMAESNLSHTITNKIGAFGIAQWLGDRKKRLFSKYGKNPTFEQQLEFIWEELNTNEKNAFNHLLTTKSASEAADSIMQNFERPSKSEQNSSREKRRKNAQRLDS